MENHATTNVHDMLELCQKLINEGKGDYIFSNDGYVDIDFDVQDYAKTIMIW